MLLLYGIKPQVQETDSIDKFYFNNILSQQTKNNYKFGETLTYKVKFRFLTFGKAKLHIDTMVHIINDRPTYKIELSARTSHIVRWFAPIDDIIGSYTDTGTFNTLKSYKYINESGYTRDEVVYYEHQSSRAKVYAMTRDETVFDKGKYYSLLPNSYDITTIIMNLRSRNLDKIKKGDKILGNCFFENVNYFSTLYFDRKEVLRTTLGKLNTIVFKGATQKSTFLKDTEEPVHTIWLSDDENHLILKIETETVYGKVRVILTDVESLKYPLTSKYRKKKD